ncbi:MAG: EAL domain-containing protein [Rhodoferax sp.]|nr:EAL domain-containing protein [Rhodoferax sp.]
MPIQVLLIESDSERAHAVQSALLAARTSWQVEVAASMSQALERQSAGAVFDVALVNYQLTDGLAAEAVALARAMPAVLSVRMEDEWAAARALRQGYSDYMVLDGHGGELQTLPDLLDAVLARWRQQRQLEEAALRYELVLAGSDLVAWERYLPDGQVLASERLFDMLGYGAAQWQQYSSTGAALDVSLYRRLVHRDDWAALQDATQAHLRGETPSYRCEYRMRHQAGHWIWVLSRGRVMQRDAQGVPVRMLGTVADITARRADQEAATRQNRLLQAVSVTQGLVIASGDASSVFEQLLNQLLDLSESRFGFVGEVFFTPERQPYLKTFAMSDISWDDASRRAYAQSRSDGMTFSNPNSLFGSALLTAQPVIANDPSNDPRRCGTPSGHPALDAFMGIPIHYGNEMVAMVGLANKVGGYSQADVDFLEPFCLSIGQLVQARRNDAERQRAQDELKKAAALLAEKTQSLKTTLDSMSQGIVMVNPSGRISVYNRCALELLDLPESLMAAKPTYAEVVQFQKEQGHFGDDYASVEPLGRDYVARGEAFDAPRRYLRKTRSGRTIEIVTHMLQSGDMVRTYSDITEQLEADEKLRESEARFRGLTALSSDGFWEQDQDYRFVRLEGNLRQSGNRLGTGRIGDTRWEIPTFNMSEEQWQAHRAVLDARGVFRDLELERRSSNGDVFWVSVSGEPIFDANGEFRGYRGVGRDITARKRVEAQIEKLAFFDSLTELPNRRMLLDRLAQALGASARRLSHGGLLFIDLDNFKMLNDTMGHDMGDQLLQQVAQRLNQCVRQIDTVARLGGDEFVVMLEELSEDRAEAATQAEAVGKKILHALNQPFVLANQQHYSSPSIGITLFSDQLETVDELLKRADLAMYQAKAAGRNTMRFFDPAMQAIVSARAALEADLRQGLTQGELLLYYQPVVNLEGHTTGVEALVRWLHPAHGMVAPADFIALAEQSGLILSLGQWVLETACDQLVAWSSSPATQHLSMAINVSAREFHHPEFAARVLDLLAKTGANPYRLKIELTESLLLSDAEDTVAKMTELRSIGVNFSLDDFGTGYSSLSYLKRLPLDQLKIDQSFVRDVLTDPNDAAIVRTILSLAQSLDLSVVAEGVETQGQREFLERYGCKAFQGYLFGRPVPARELRLT